LPKTNKDFQNLKKEYEDEYNLQIKNKITQFKNYINGRNKEEIEKIFNIHYSYAKKMESEDKFKEYYEVKGLVEPKRKKLMSLKNLYPDEYEIIFNNYKEKFNSEHSNLVNAKMVKHNAIFNMMNNNFDNIANISKSRAEFEDNLENLLKKSSLCQPTDTIFKSNLNTFKQKFETRLIDNFLKDNENEIIHKSNNFEEFKAEFDKLKISKEECLKTTQNNKIYEEYFSAKNEENIKNKIKEYKKSIVSQINDFFRENNNSFKECLNENEFRNKVESTAPTNLKNSDKFKDILMEKIVHFNYEKIEKDHLVNIGNNIGNETYNDDEFFNKLDNISIEKFQTFIGKIFSEKKINQNIDKNIMNFISFLLQQGDKKVTKLNVIILGMTGIGKSTLINSVLELNNNQRAPIESHRYGEPVTQETRKYLSQAVPYLGLIDTRGTEINRDYNIDTVLNKTIEYIDDSLKSNNPDNFIHCIWYCVNPYSQRLETVEEKFLITIQEKYKSNKLPVIIVGTKATSNTFNSNFENILNARNIKYPFIPVIAEPIDHNQKKGLKELKEITIDLASRAVESACFEGIIKKAISESDSFIKTSKINIETDISNLSENTRDVSNIKDDIKTLIFLFMNKYLSIKFTDNDEIIQINKNDYNTDVDKLVKDYYESCEAIYKSSYLKIKELKINEYYNEIKNAQYSFTQNKEYENFKFSPNNEEDIKKKIKDKIETEFFAKAQKFYDNKIYKKFIEKFGKYLSDYFNLIYNNIIEDIRNNPEHKNIIINGIQSQFEEIKNRLNNRQSN
jgi:hypothetical protein